MCQYQESYFTICPERGVSSLDYLESGLCAPVQFDQRFYYSLPMAYNIKHCFMEILKILANLCR